MIRTIKRLLREPSILFDLACYFMVMTAIIWGGNTLQDVTRQRQLDANEDHVRKHVSKEADRVIREIKTRKE